MQMRSSSMRWLLCTSALAAAALSMSGEAYGQAQAPTPTQDITTANTPANGVTAESAPADMTGGLQDIVVTAQRRNESAQKVPISILSINESELKQRGVATTNDLPLVVPGFQISSSGANQLYYLRGVGSQQVGIGQSAEVATFVDGVYMPFTASALQAFNSISGIEVDKGPQGTLFGRNATGGVIQINTKDPKFDFSGDFSAGYANYEHPTGQAYITGGITSNIAADLALIADHQGKGYGTNTTTGNDVFKKSVYGARTKFLIDVSDTTQIRISADVSHIDSDAGASLRRAKGVQLWDTASNTQQNTGFYDTTQNTAVGNSVTDYGGSIKITSKLGEVNFLSITAYRAYHLTTNVDFDGGPETVVPVLNKQNESSITQELQLSSPVGSTITWTGGLFFLSQRGRVDPFRFGAPFPTIALPFGIPLGDDYALTGHTRTTSIAGYGQATATIFRDTHLTLGARYTYDIRKINGYGEAIGPVAPAPYIVPGTQGDQKATFKKPTFRVGLDHDFSPAIKVYASFNTGFQSGTFNGNPAGGYSPAANPALKPETITAYEAGFKSELFDRHVRLNVSAFYYKYSNLQQQIYVNNTLVTLNAGGAHNKGVDFEFQYQPTTNFTIGFSGELLNAKFSDYANAPGYIYPLGFGKGPLVPVIIANAKGNYLPFAPKYSGAAFANYGLNTSIGKLNTSGTISYNDGYYADASNLYKEPQFITVNLTEQWVPNDNVSISLWVKNLFDVRYDQSVAAVGGLGYVGASPGAPREYGFTARYHF